VNTETIETLALYTVIIAFAHDGRHWLTIECDDVATFQIGVKIVQ
jgi:hypothetical protein